MDRLESFGQLRDIDTENGRVSSVISTGDVARDGAIIEPAGWDFTFYDQNPVVLWMHNADTPPFARTIEHKTSKSKLSATAQFDLDDPFAITLLRKIDQGYVNATSVRWLPKKTEIRKVGKGKDEREVLVFVEQELLEWSFVTVPADPKALIVRADGQPLSLADYLPAGYCTRTPYDAEEQEEEEEEGEPEDPERPYPNEHACRVREPSAFQPNSFRRIKRTHEGKPYSIIIGKLKGESKTTTQAIRYPKDSWTADAARAHCNAHDGKTFEPAAKSATPKQAESMTSKLQIAEARLTGYLVRRSSRPTANDIIIAELAKATGKTEERIRRELAEGGYAQ